MPSKQKSRKIKQRLEQEEAASNLQIGFPSASSAHNSSSIEGLISSIPLTREDQRHFSAVQQALATIATQKPLLNAHRKVPGLPLIIEKGVLEVPVADVKSALAYYDNLKQDGGLNENHKVIVKMARRALVDLANLRRQQRLQKGVAVVEDPEEGECVVL